MAETPHFAFDPEMFDRDGGVSRETITALVQYETLLKTWQKAVNLVGRGTIGDVWHRHFLDSAQLLPWIPRSAASGGPVTLLDVGSGAGFPGLILAILAARAEVPGLELDVHLVEANARKCAFLKEVTRVTETPVTVHHCRIEDMPPFPVNVITARGFAPLPRLLDLIAPFLERPGESPLGLFLKGRSVDEELTEARKQWKIHLVSIASVTDPEGVVLRIEDIVRG
jgi:16S rRNA (guanine527-N7)-methyltransferase